MQARFLYSDHVFRMENGIKFRFCQETQGNAGFLQRNVLSIGFFCGFCRIFVADIGVQSSDQHQRTVQIFLHSLFVGFQTQDAVIVEGDHGIAEESGRLQEIVDQHRHKHIQLEIALACGNPHSGVIAHDLHSHHGDGFTLGGIDLSGHDGRTGFVFRDGDLTQTQPGSGGKPADIVGNFHQVGCQGFQCPVGEDQLVLGGQRQ